MNPLFYCLILIAVVISLKETSAMVETPSAFNLKTTDRVFYRRLKANAGGKSPFRERRLKKWRERMKIIRIFQEAQAEFMRAESFVRFRLAPSYGNLNSQSLQQLDESLRVMMGGVLQYELKEQLTWNELLWTLYNSPLLVRQPKYYPARLKRLSFRSTRFFGLNSDKTQTRTNVIDTWFKNLIGNVDIIKDTDIDLRDLSMMVSNISVHMMDNLMSKKLKKMTLMDLGILRFPDVNRPFFTVYRINLMARCAYHTFLVRQKERSDLIGLFDKEVYYPNEEFIKNLSDDIVDQLLDDVEDLFSD